MAYTHGVYEVFMLREADTTEADQVAVISATGREVFFRPALVKHRIHAVGVIISNDVGAAGRLDFDLEDGDGTVVTANVISPIFLETTHTDDMVVYRWVSDNVVVSPGQALVCDVADAGAAGDLVQVKLLVEPIYEAPANISAMVATADAAA